MNHTLFRKNAVFSSHEYPANPVNQSGLFISLSDKRTKKKKKIWFKSMNQRLIR